MGDLIEGINTRRTKSNVRRSVDEIHGAKQGSLHECDRE